SVAIHAGDIPRLMRTSLPEQPVAPLMTGQTRAVFFIDGVAGILREPDWNRVFAAPALGVGFPRAVTSLTPEFFLIIFRAREGFTHRRVLKVPALVGMADEASITARVIPRRLRCLTEPGYRSYCQENCRN